MVALWFGHALQTERLTLPVAGGRDFDWPWISKRWVPAFGYGRLRRRSRNLGLCPPRRGAERLSTQQRGNHLPRWNMEIRGFGDQHDSARKLVLGWFRTGGVLSKRSYQCLNVCGAAVIDDLCVRRIGHDARVGERLQNQGYIGLTDLQGEKVLAHHHIVVVSDTPQCVPVGFARCFRTARSRPIGRGDLQYESVTVLVPSQHALGVPRRPRLSFYRIPIELIVPKDVEEFAVIHLVERGAQRVVCRDAHTTAALLEFVVGAAGVRKLLAELSICLNTSAKQAGSLRRRARVGEGCRIELEHKPPVHLRTGIQQGGWGSCQLCRQRSDA